MVHAGVVDDDVESPEALDDAAGKRRETGAVGDIERKRLGAAGAKLSDDLGELGLRTRHEGHSRAARAELARTRQTDPTRGARNDRDRSVSLHRTLIPS